MSDKKHIDELFKEQLQNYEAAPSPAIWKNIQAKMKKEEDDRKVIPIWWRLSGVAALLVLLLALNFVFQPFGGEDPVEIVTEETVDPKTLEENTLPVDETSDPKDAITSEEIKEEGDLMETNDALQDPKIQKEASEKILQQSKKDGNAVAVENSSKEKVQTSNKEVVVPETNAIKQDDPKKGVGIRDAVATTTSEENKKGTQENRNPNPLIKQNTEVEGSAKKGVIGVAKTTDDPKKGLNKTEEGVAVEEKSTNTDPQKGIVEGQETGNPVKEAVAVEENLEEKVEKDPLEEKKKSIFDAIEENKEDAVAKTNDRDLKNWEVTPNFGPVFYNSLNGGSAIDPSFADNSQSGEVNFSYGVQVSYAITDRLSIRSGVSNVDLGYTTGDVELATGPVDIALGTIDYQGRNVVLSAFDRGTLNNLPPPSGENDPFARLNPKSTSGNAELIQNISYFEVPMELKYALVDNRFGLNMIGGFSTLFLGNNEVSVRDGSFRELLGEANNLNQVSFSTNVGLGFDYKISKRLKFNVEPMFKYQLNPYTDSSVDFRPYYFGIYSGLSFKF